MRAGFPLMSSPADVGGGSMINVTKRNDWSPTGRARACTPECGVSARRRGPFDNRPPSLASAQLRLARLRRASASSSATSAVARVAAFPHVRSTWYPAEADGSPPSTRLGGRAGSVACAITASGMTAKRLAGPLLLLTLSLALLLTAATAAQAATYFIDDAGGSDSINGTSTSTPWKRAPGMQGCTATCAATTPQPGDRFILKGGVTWHRDALTWNWR